jgi:hypothetical protein
MGTVLAANAKTTPTSRPPQGVRQALPLTVALVVAAGSYLFLGGFTNDDAAISFAYARSAASGLPAGVVVAGGQLVEGYSNTAWTALLAVGDRLGVNPDTAAKILGLAFLLGTVFLVDRLISDATDRPFARWGTVVAGGSFTLVLWSTSGLETPLTAVRLVLGAGSFHLEQRRAAAVGFGSAGAAVGLVLARPEGFVYAGAVALAKVLSLLREPAGRRAAPAARWLAVVAVPVVLFVIWHVRHFGELFPNTVTAKVRPVSAGDRVRAVVDPNSLNSQRTREWLTESGLALLVPFAFVGAVARIRDRRPAVVLVGLSSLALPLSEVDWMPDFRFYAPVVPFLVVLAAIGVAALLDGGALRRLSPAVRRVGGLALLLVPLGASAIVAVHARADDYPGQVTRELVRSSFAPLVADAHRLGLHDPLVMLPDAGATVYDDDLRVLDSAGLLDYQVARALDDPEALQTYAFEEQRPELVSTHGVFTQAWRLSWATMEQLGYVPLRTNSDQYGEHGDFIRSDLVFETIVSGRNATGVALRAPSFAEPGATLLVRATLFRDIAEGRVEARLVGADGAAVAVADVPVGMGIEPVGDWPTDQLMIHTLLLAVPPTAAPGDYRVVVSVNGHTVEQHAQVVADAASSGVPADLSLADLRDLRTAAPGAARAIDARIDELRAGAAHDLTAALDRGETLERAVARYEQVVAARGRHQPSADERHLASRVKAVTADNATDRWYRARCVAALTPDDVAAQRDLDRARTDHLAAP